MGERTVLACRWMMASVIIVSSARAMPPQSEDQSGAKQQRQAVAQGSKTAVIPERGGSVWAPADAQERSSASVSGAAVNFVHDQKDIWASPARLHFSDTEWLVPLGGLTAGLLVSDRQFSGHLSRSPSTQQHYRTVANGGVAALVGAGGGLALWSTITHDAHQRETGFLAGEAAVDALIPVEVLKYAAGRQRPFEGNGAGHFLDRGSSFPSEHAAAAWSIAGIIAHEYPGPFPKMFAYGLASAVTASRVRSRDHFPSDVLVGSAIGWLVSQHVYSKHHDSELGGSEWSSWSALTRSFDSPEPGHRGSPYVPLDSWVYPAFDRLIGMGMVDSAFAGVRPWTRSECVRLLNEASDKIEAGPAEAERIYRDLQAEFQQDLEDADENGAYHAKLESVYTRLEDISGQPLTLADGYTFGQTLINDFGRPYERGFNSVTGFATWTTAGRWVGYVRGEYQQSPSAPALPESARLTIGVVDHFPGTAPDTPISSINRFRLLDAYVGLNIGNWQTTFGQQSLWWGPGNGGPLELSDNSPPIKMFRINRITPLELPSFLRWLGPMRAEFFFGQLSGQEFLLNPSGLVGQYGKELNPQPFFHGQLISFKPTPNFEFAFFRTTIFGGPGYPLNWHHVISSVFSTGNTLEGSASKPGDRGSGLSYSYRLPGVRNWLTLYGDSFTDDEYSPIAYMDVSAQHAGLYLSHFPGVSHLDLRLEGVYTDIPGGSAKNTKDPGTFFENSTWRSGYTNEGDLMGSWIGRGGQGAQAWSNYWFGPRNRLQFNFRHQKVSPKFIPGGGSLTDLGVRSDYWLRPDLSLSLSVQGERWLFPVIQPNRSRNVVASLQITFQPQKELRLHRSPGSTTIGDQP